MSDVLREQVKGNCRFIGEDGRCKECGLCDVVMGIYEALKAISYQGGLMEFMDMHCEEERESLENALAQAEGGE